MSKKITVPVSKWNNHDYATACSKEICCDYTVVGTYWKQPLLDTGGMLLGYTYTAATESKPDNSFKIVRVQACGDQVEVVLDDAEDATLLATACNICCGDAPTEFTGTIPALVQEVKPCENADGDRVVCVAYPAGTGFTLAGTFDGTAGTPAPGGSNPFTAASDILTWLNANWSAYGVFTQDVTNKVICLTLANAVTSAGITITKA